MKSTINTLEIEIMDRGNFSYTGDGNSKMDKTDASSLAQYSHGNQFLTVECHFSGASTLRDAVKQYILERRAKNKLDGVKNPLYNGHGNTTAVTATKEESI